MNKSRLNTTYFSLAIIVMSTGLAFFKGAEDDRNLLVISFLCVSPLYLLLRLRVHKTDLILFSIACLMFVNPLLVAPDSYRISTVVYSLLFFVFFMAFRVSIISGDVTVRDYWRVLRFLIFAYCFTLLTQQLCVAFGLPIFNESNYFSGDPWKLNSLAYEPSHSARIICILMYCYLVVRHLDTGCLKSEHKNNKHDFFLWVAFLWTILTMGSTATIVFILPILLLIFGHKIKARNLLGLVFLLPFILTSSEYERASLFIAAMGDFNILSLIETDASSAIRIVPQIIVASSVDLSSLQGWFGYGIDYSANLLHAEMPMLKEGATGGGFFQIWLEYGFVTFALLTFYTLRVSYCSSAKIGLFFWVLMVFMYGINSQIVWLTMTLLACNKYFLEQVGDNYLVSDSNPIRRMK